MTAMNDSNQPVDASGAASLREALLDLAFDVSSYLRHNARRAVRVSAALLIAASLAACGPSGSAQSGSYPAVQPLAQEIRRGLPTQPGRYLVVPNTLGRDAQGVYHFSWRRPGDPAGTQYSASTSLLRLAQGPANEIDIPAVGDPTLYLPSDASIPLVNSADEILSGYNSGGGYYSTWHPFYGGYRGVGYYDPPTRTASGGSVDGAKVSTSPAPSSERVVGLSRAVSSRAGGTGAGTAATNKSGASTSSVDHGGAAAAKSGSFSAGHASSGASSSSSGSSS